MHHRLPVIAIFLSLTAAECLAQPTAAQNKDVSLTPPKGLKTKLAPGYSIPTVDISGESQRQTIVDRKAGQYLGHPTTVLLEDSRTMLIVYPKGHGRGEVVYKRSTDGGRTWSERMPWKDRFARFFARVAPQHPSVRIPVGDAERVKV